MSSGVWMPAGGSGQVRVDSKATQYMIHQTLREMSKRFDELIRPLEWVLSKVTQMSSRVRMPAGDSGQVS